ncbi:BlaI/MecI/CopY family transcriptional regulator [Streptomyces sp. NPDC050418]|uniref:BlaI/MecI/CopY family transcriptional regulator n=1 Tax=Streptomyces sp. NPDC050418 TaxID=3365612 RepID=UPI0037AC7384
MGARGESGDRSRRRGQGELEGQVLAVLGTAGKPVSAGWVQERLGGDLAYTTVLTILARLMAKDAVTRERDGRSFVWTSAADEAGLAALRMRKVLDGENDREAVLASFVTALPPGDERLLRELLGQAEADEEPDLGEGLDPEADADAHDEPGGDGPGREAGG